MKVYSVSLIHTENGYPEARKRTLRVNEGENVFDLAKSLYANPITIISMYDEFKDNVTYINANYLGGIE